MHFEQSHIGICVSDMERALRFYRQGLGFAKGRASKSIILSPK